MVAPPWRYQFDNAPDPYSARNALGIVKLFPTAGVSVTIVTAPLTGGGAGGSMTFVDGVLTAQTPAT